MKEMPEKFHLITPEPECTNVSFWYLKKKKTDDADTDADGNADVEAY